MKATTCILLLVVYITRVYTLNTTTVTFNVTSIEGLVEQLQYTWQQYSECFYDGGRDLLRCMKNYPYSEVTPVWKKQPELIKYVRVNCLMTNPKRKGTCICKDISSVPRGGSTDEKYYGCQLNVLNASAFKTVSSMEVLDLSDNLINQIDRGALSGLNSLRYCSLDRNTLNDMPTGLFCDTPNIEFISLNGLMLEHFPSHSFICKTPLNKVTVVEAKGSKLKDVPADSLDYLPSLRSLDLGNNDLNSIYKKSFAGTTGLEYLNLSGNELKELFPHFCRYMRNLTHLHLRANLFTAVNMDEFDDCSNIVDLDISGNLISRLTGNATSLSSLLTLNVSRNVISFLGVDFYGQTRLEFLDFSQNNLSHFSDDQFQGLENLKLLNLSKNVLNISDNFDVVFRPLSMLESVDLSNNKLTSLPNSSFSTLSKLKRLYIRDNEIVNLAPVVFTGLDSLDYLALDNNRLSILTGDLFGPLHSLKHLSISFNRLASIDISSWPSLFTLQLNNNNISSLPSSLPFTDLQKLDVSNNRLTSFVGTDENLYVNFNNMKYLDISHNLISDMSPKVFQTMKSILSLKCNHNRLTLNLSQSLFSDTSNFTLLNLANNNIAEVSNMLTQSSLTGILELNLSSNPLQTFDNIGYSSSAKLENFDISNCSLSTIRSDVFSSFHALKAVNLAQNNFETFPAFKANTDAIFYFTGNPLKCACNMSWLLDNDVEVDGTRVAASRYKLPKCSLYTENGLFNPRILERRQFLCPSVRDCDPLCSCFKMNYTGTVTMAVCRNYLKLVPSLISKSALSVFLDGNDFSKENALLPFVTMENMAAKEIYLNNSAIATLDHRIFLAFGDLEILSLADNVLELLPAGIFANKKKLRQIYLNNNLLQTIESDVFQNLQNLDELDISGNNFVVLSPNTLSDLSSLNARYFFLAGNPWACNCSNSAFKEFVDGVEWKIRDRRSLFCDESNREILQLSMSSFSCAASLEHHKSGKPAMIVGLIICIVAIFIAIAGLVYYRRELVAILNFKTGFHFPSRKHFPGMHFDVYISYDPSDQYCSFYVQNTLLPKLKNNSFNVQTSTDVIEDAEVVQKVIEDSKSSIFIVSKNFSSNTFQQKTFQNAVQTHKRDKKHKVVLIILGDIDLHVMETEVVRRLRKGDYVTSRSRLWWERLVYELPEPSGIVNEAENDDVSESDVIVFSSLNRDQYEAV